MFGPCPAVCGQDQRLSEQSIHPTELCLQQGELHPLPLLMELAGLQKTRLKIGLFWVKSEPKLPGNGAQGCRACCPRGLSPVVSGLGAPAVLSPHLCYPMGGHHRDGPESSSGELPLTWLPQGIPVPPEHPSPHPWGRS